jgi:regulator of replication initiation timing
MRRKKNREINIFSISALDLFASAMGVFLLIAIVALPYYLKVDPEIVDEIGQVKQKITKLEEENKRLRDQQIATLLGLSTSAKSFVLVVDMSGSMQAYTTIVSETVDKIIESLSDEYKLQILGYHLENRLHPWKTPYNLAKMDANAKKEAMVFMQSLTQMFSGGTPTKLALAEALKYDAEAIILLTDGAPSFNNPTEIVRDITVMNGGKKEIYSIAIGEYRAQPILVEFLEALSRQNGGGFLGISSY